MRACVQPVKTDVEEMLKESEEKSKTISCCKYYWYIANFTKQKIKELDNLWIKQ